VRDKNCQIGCHAGPNKVEKQEVIATHDFLCTILHEKADVTAFLERMCDFVEDVLSRDVIVELSGASDVEREPSDFAADFALFGFRAVIFGSSGSEFGDGVSVIEFVTNQIAGKNHVTSSRPIREPDLIPAPVKMFIK